MPLVGNLEFINIAGCGVDTSHQIRFIFRKPDGTVASDRNAVGTGILVVLGSRCFIGLELNLFGEKPTRFPTGACRPDRAVRMQRHAVATGGSSPTGPLE